ncbi:hypothetical protein [Dactylosporangium darangshiense]|uniref:hypothetical protein n=1 Tax=Dactylosporangium darangshiense TaxID=579108 RepID=UPI0036332A10
MRNASATLRATARSWCSGLSERSSCSARPEMMRYGSWRRPRTTRWTSSHSRLRSGPYTTSTTSSPTSAAPRSPSSVVTRARTPASTRTTIVASEP